MLTVLLTPIVILEPWTLMWGWDIVHVSDHGQPWWARRRTAAQLIPITEHEEYEDNEGERSSENVSTGESHGVFGARCGRGWKKDGIYMLSRLLTGMFPI